MIQYSKYPFLRILVAYILGILVYEYLPYRTTPTLIWSILLILIAAVFISAWQRRFKVKRDWIFGFLVTVTMAFSGYFFTHFHNPTVEIPSLENASSVICRIKEDPVPKSKAYKCEAFIYKAYIDGDWVDINKGVLLYSPLSDKAPWQYDDIVQLKSIVSEPKPPANPRQFNFKKYLQKNNVYYQSYVKEDEFKVIGKDDQLTLHDLSHSVVAYAKKVFYTGVPDSSLAGIATALTIGNQEGLDPEVKTSFSRVGAMHILAVSGLHVGIIFLMLSRLLFFLDKHKGTRFLKMIILVTILWGYAFVVGFSPSIIRASLMFTILMPALSFKFSGNIYNNISCSAFFILLFNPNYLFEVGFELSYAAVVGIVYLFPLLRNWVKSKYRVVNYLWQLTAVSISAQLFTTPIVLFYFGQFPLSFFISNIVAVPLATLIIFTSIAALVLYPVPYIGILASKILYVLLLILKYSVQQIENIPFAYLDHLLINRWQAILLFLFIISGILYFQFRNKKFIYANLVFLSTLFITFIIHRYEVLQNREFIIYDLNKTFYCEYQHGHHAVNILNAELSDLSYGLFIRSYHQSKGIFYRDGKSNEVSLSYPGFQIRDKTFYVVDDKIPRSKIKLKIDFLILSNISYLDMNQLETSFDPKRIIILNNHPKRKLNILDNLLVESDYDYFNMKKSGHYKVSW